ncbi:uncharacterized protein BO80DRAFT_497896 [Aspergillus ibericus CBS 121593]|uniref:BTB domain-containing protein n=1 Tax=Aspergillus ibericus CBS 121593 TaxID=1448316 RepID=A0A395GIV0_9EURO|nr:hypothetical protein BO80DRAFT_497896 [Aspergillus ibericus CBS 121593]RAK95202.1 hypothetical protein BO80DRAFT_497896 [Aspergillus ibericus CBS 121593]
MPVHVLDAEGEVMITLTKPNEPFAPYDHDPTDSDSEADPHIERLRRGIAMIVDVGLVPDTYLTPDLRTVTVPPEPDRQEADGTIDGVWVPAWVDEPRKRRSGKKVQTEDQSDRNGNPSEAAVIQYQASAKHLASASPFFKALLLSGLRESVKFKTEGSVTVSTEGWDANALLYVLKILHCKHHELPRQVDLTMLAKVCVVGDFYGCQDAVRFATQCWIGQLEPGVPNTKYRPLVLWIWLSYFFRMAAQFKEVTSIAITQGKGLIETLGLPIPATIMDAINDRRQEAITELIDHVYEERDRYLSGEMGCSFECSAMMYGGIAKNLVEHKMTPADLEAPFHNHSYMSLVRIIERFRTPRWFDVGASLSNYGYQYVNHQCRDSTLSSLRDGWNGYVDGLDLKQFVELR